MMEAFGLRIDALSLYYTAWRGRDKLLGSNHRTTVASREDYKRLQEEVDRQY